MYQFPQQPHGPSQLARLPLAKFSHTVTSISHSGPLNWSHIIGNGDIICVFEKRPGTTPTSTQVLLRVSRDQDILEEIDIAYFAREAVAAQGQRQVGQSKPIFAVIVKLPCMAVKYPSGGTSIRRFQLKFASDRDYYTALAILSDLKCPFSESNIGSMQPTRKLTSSQWSSGAVSMPVGLEAASISAGSSGSYTSTNTFPSLPTRCTSEMRPSSTTDPIIPSSSSTVHPTTDFTAPNRELSMNMRIPSDAIYSQPAPVNQAITDPISRPHTEPACDPQALNQLLPPKRDLPFSKPPAKKARTQTSKPGKENERPSTGTEEPTSTQIPTQKDPNTAKKPAKARKKPGPKPKRCATALPELSTVQPQKEINILPKPTQNTQQPQQQKSAPTPLLPIPPIPIQQPSQQNTTTAIPPTLPIPHPAHQTSPTPTPTHQEHHQDLNSNLNLTTYLSSPASERTAKLESWICKHIEDDEFLQLCQDVEGVWKRVALGM